MFPSRRPGLTIHSPSATVGIQRSQGARDTATRITLPSHPAIGAQKPQPPHTMTQVTAARWRPAFRIQRDSSVSLRFCFIFVELVLLQKPIFSPVTPVAAATVAPIVATNTVPSTTTIGELLSICNTRTPNKVDCGFYFCWLCLNLHCLCVQALCRTLRWPVTLLSPWRWRHTHLTLRLSQLLPSLSVSVGLSCAQ